MYTIYHGFRSTTSAITGSFPGTPVSSTDFGPCSDRSYWKPRRIVAYIIHTYIQTNLYSAKIVETNQRRRALGFGRYLITSVMVAPAIISEYVPHSTGYVGQSSGRVGIRSLSILTVPIVKNLKF